FVSQSVSVSVLHRIHSEFGCPLLFVQWFVRFSASVHIPIHIGPLPVQLPFEKNYFSLSFLLPVLQPQKLLWKLLYQSKCLLLSFSLACPFNSSFLIFLYRIL